MTSFTQKFFKAILPASMFQKMQTESRRWYFECACGTKTDLWDAGGIRYGAKGSPKRAVTCPACNKSQMVTLRQGK